MLHLRQWAFFLALTGSLAACRGYGGGGTGPIVNPDGGGDTGTVNPGDAGDTGTPPDGTTGCAAPSQMCGATCVNPRTDPRNCGACGRACSGGQACIDGSCQSTTSCAAPRMMCGDACTDVTIDTSNCGSCGRACSGGQTCDGGTCRTTTTCTAPRMMCGGSCVDVQTSSAHCGVCNAPCGASQRCQGARCVNTTTCDFPRMTCSGICVDTTSDSFNCGSCGRACPSGQSCAGGTCTGGGTGSPAGGRCATDTECGALSCDTSITGGFCTDNCTNSTSQTTERSMCGGTGATCLAIGDGAAATAFCTRACSVSASSEAAGGCRAGQICTGWWYTHTGGPDVAGCFPFCENDSHCASGMRCNTRSHSCSVSAFNPSALADGSPCDPTITTTPPGETRPRNTQCRGLCYATSSAVRSRGICGSMINVRTSPSCPDPGVTPLTEEGADNLGLCLYRTCTSDIDCRSPLTCQTTASGARVCNYAP